MAQYFYRIDDAELGPVSFAELTAKLGSGEVRLAPLPAFLGTLGMPGLTAYAGLLDVGALKDGETVLVSGAAGAVGSVVCQIAKAKGCKVIGVMGSDEKGRWLLENGCADQVINYRTTPKLKPAIQAAAPDGIDLTFENVGGDHLEAALACSKVFGRIVICGLISTYNTTTAAPGPSNFREILVKRISRSLCDGDSSRGL